MLWGLLFGGILAILLVVNRIFIGALARFAGINNRSGLGFLFVSEGIYFVIALTLFFVAGCIAAHRAHRIEPGIRAGLVAGVLVGLVALAVAVHSATATPHAVIHAGRALRLSASQARPAATFVRGILAALTLILVGTGLGALGGLAGRGKSPMPETAHPYMPMPQPSVPVTAYPPAGSYTPPPPVYPPNDAPTLHSNGPRE